MTSKTQPTNASTHLDLGCGSNPRNPYQRSRLYGCDIVRLPVSSTGQPFEFIQADLTSKQLDLPESYFDSISAFDFIEHIQRQSVDQKGMTYNPFIQLMNEVYRLLKPNGLFIASTPCYPHPTVFQDPTHVNFITEKTHEYFCIPEVYASRYGFIGKFKVIKAQRESQKNILRPQESVLRKRWRDFEYRYFKGGLSHITWELQALKTE